jgi:hypothetical protein
MKKLESSLKEGKQETTKIKIEFSDEKRTFQRNGTAFLRRMTRTRGSALKHEGSQGRG